MNRRLLALILVGIWAVTSLTGSGQEMIFTVGILNSNFELESLVENFRDAMSDHGFREGIEVNFIYQGPILTDEEINAEIEKIQEGSADLLLTTSSAITEKAQTALAGEDTPIIFAPVVDPVNAGFVDSIRQPNGVLTGIQAGTGNIEKALQWLITIVPSIPRIYTVLHRGNSDSESSLVKLQDLGSYFNVEIVVEEADTPEEIARAFEDIPEDVDAVFVLPATIPQGSIESMVEQARARNLPTASGLPLQDYGIMVTFAVDPARIAGQVAQIAESVLDGARPSEIPVEQSEYFLGINLCYASDIDVNILDAILNQAEFIVRCSEEVDA